MKSKKILAQLLHWGFVHMRAEAAEFQYRKIFIMASFLHNLPLEIAKATTEAEYDAVLADFEDFCKDNVGMMHFIHQVKASRLE